MATRQTLASEIATEGVALHAGVMVRMRLCPAPAHTGILFRRTDRHSEIPALWTHVGQTHLGTVLTNTEGHSVGVIEHLMAALAGAEIDDCIVELDGPEPPILDGDALSYLHLIEKAGVRAGDVPRSSLHIRRTIEVGDDKAWVRLSPAGQSEYAFDIDFSGSAIGRQHYAFAFTAAGFRDEIAPARTFGFLSDAEKLRAAGFARGASLENTLVIDGPRIVNETVLRFADEFVRHKILDAIGDMKLAGAPLIGRFEGHCSSHKLNNELLHALFADPDNYERVE